MFAFPLWREKLWSRGHGALQNTDHRWRASPYTPRSCKSCLRCPNHKTDTCIYLVFGTHQLIRKWEIAALTPTNPCNTRATMSPFMSHRARTGINRDMANMNKLLRPNMHLAPNCLASNPPGNCNAQCNQ